MGLKWYIWGNGVIWVKVVGMQKQERTQEPSQALSAQPVETLCKYCRSRSSKLLVSAMSWVKSEWVWGNKTQSGTAGLDHCKNCQVKFGGLWLYSMTLSCSRAIFIDFKSSISGLFSLVPCLSLFVNVYRVKTYKPFQDSGKEAFL